MKYIQTDISTLSNSICLWLCYHYIADENFTNYSLSTILHILAQDIEAGIVSEDGFVNRGDALLLNVIKSNIAPKNKLYCSRWTKGNYSHWVVMKNGKIEWNPLKESQCVLWGTEAGDYRYSKD